MHKIFVDEFTITQDFLDINGHVNNVLFVQWMQDAAIKHAVENKCDRDLLAKIGAMWVARSHNVKYLSSTFDGDVLQVSTWLSEARKVSCLRQYRFNRKSDGKLLTQAETEWVFVDLKSGRPKKIDAQVMSLFEIVENQT